MSTLEQTVSMLEILPERDVKSIHDFIYRVYICERSPFEPLTKEQVLADLEISRREIENGDYVDFDEAIHEIEAAYGL